MSLELSLTIATIAIVIALPLVFVFANWVRKNIDHGEARFGPDGKMISDEKKNDE